MKQRTHFLYLQKDNIYLGVASDHTDRGIEKNDVEKSKQICPVILSDLVWDYNKIKEWNSTTIKSWAYLGNDKVLYQDASVGIFMKPEEIIDFVKEETKSDINNSVILCGTPPIIPDNITKEIGDLHKQFYTFVEHFIEIQNNFLQKCMG